MTGQTLAALYDLTEMLSLVMALALAAYFFGTPSRFAAQTSLLSWWQRIIIVGAICAGTVHNTGFRLRRLCGCLVFLPLQAILVMIGTPIYSFS